MLTPVHSSNEQLSIRTGPWGTRRKLSGLMNHSVEHRHFVVYLLSQVKSKDLNTKSFSTMLSHAFTLYLHVS